MTLAARQIFFTVGTDTGVGKTLISAALLVRMRELGRRAVGIKPVETGCTHDQHHDLVGSDGAQLFASSSPGIPPLVVAPYRFIDPVTPAVAAERAGTVLRLSDLVDAILAASTYGDVLVVEGAGGALSPLTTDALGLDLAEAIGATLLVVGKNSLGTQSHTLLVLEAARRRALNLAGVILSNVTVSASGPQEIEENERMIRERGGVRVFPSLPHIEGDRQAKITAAASHVATTRLAEAMLDACERP